jgi:hypothetical protein
MSNIIKFLLTIFFVSLLAYVINSANAANYAHVYNGNIVTRYEADSPKPFGGDWQNGTSYLIPENVNPDLAIFQNGEIVERAKTSEEIESEAKEIILQNIKKGEKVIAHVIYLNDLRSATDQVKLGFLALESVKQAKELLSIGRISMAKAVIENVSVDGTLITTELKSAIIAYIDSL